MVVALIAAVTLMVSSLSSFADDDFSKEVVKATQLSPILYMLEGAGGNMTASIGTDGVLLVDDDFTSMSDRLTAKLKELKGAAPRFIINTHFHYDHTGANEIFGPAAIIIAATAVRTRLMSEQTLWKKQHPAAPARAWPILIFHDSIKLHFNDEEIEAVHLPGGHTDGDSVVFFNHEKVVSMGDLYFSGMYPIFHAEHGGSLNGYIKNIEKVLTRITDDWKIVPGHGPLSTKSELAKYHTMILASVGAVKRGIESGLTLDQIKRKGLPTQCEIFSHGYLSTDRWIELIYRSLAPEQKNIKILRST